ncbi:uncharacterized protein LOC135691337 [Rhopilema esculentum]|uniref:uncharacterized protein LOC135691337 n=1 Tax=Rhopilema esculentum TaxID=499914 RepID=UPI0031D35BF0
MSKLFTKLTKKDSSERKEKKREAKGSSGKDAAPKSDVISATILGAVSDSKAILTLSRTLKRNSVIHIDNHASVTGTQGDDEATNTKSLLDYLKRPNTNCLVVVGSPELQKVFDDSGNSRIHIAGGNIAFCAKTLNARLRDEAKAKMILISFSDHPKNIPKCFKGCECLILKESQPEAEISRLNTEKLVSALRRKSGHMGISTKSS